MRTVPWPAYLWPGLPQLWIEGAWTGLAVALTAAGLLDVLLLSTLVWEEWLGGGLLKAGWLAAVVFWIGAAVGTAVAQSKKAHLASELPEDLFRRAQGEYLQGDYFQAEATLAEILQTNPRDAEARLLLATLLRHSRRYDEAEAQLRQLARFETAARWNIEITSERARLKRLRKEVQQQTERQTTGSSADAAQTASTEAIQTEQEQSPLPDGGNI